MVNLVERLRNKSKDKPPAAQSNVAAAADPSDIDDPFDSFEPERPSTSGSYGFSSFGAFNDDEIVDDSEENHSQEEKLDGNNNENNAAKSANFSVGGGLAMFKRGSKRNLSSQEEDQSKVNLATVEKSDSILPDENRITDDSTLQLDEETDSSAQEAYNHDRSFMPPPPPRPIAMDTPDARNQDLSAITPQRMELGNNMETSISETDDTFPQEECFNNIPDGEMINNIENPPFFDEKKSCPCPTLDHGGSKSVVDHSGNDGHRNQSSINFTQNLQLQVDNKRDPSTFKGGKSLVASTLGRASRNAVDHSGNDKYRNKSSNDLTQTSHLQVNSTKDSPAFNRRGTPAYSTIGSDSRRTLDHSGNDEYRDQASNSLTPTSQLQGNGAKDVPTLNERKALSYSTPGHGLKITVDYSGNGGYVDQSSNNLKPASQLQVDGTKESLTFNERNSLSYSRVSHDSKNIIDHSNDNYMDQPSNNPISTSRMQEDTFGNISTSSQEKARAYPMNRKRQETPIHPAFKTKAIIPTTSQEKTGINPVHRKRRKTPMHLSLQTETSDYCQDTASDYSTTNQRVNIQRSMKNTQRIDTPRPIEKRDNAPEDSTKSDTPTIATPTQTLPRSFQLKTPNLQTGSEVTPCATITPDIQGNLNQSPTQPMEFYNPESQESFDEMLGGFLCDIQMVKDRHHFSEDALLEMNVKLDLVNSTMYDEILQMQEIENALDKLDQAYDDVLGLYQPGEN